MKTQNIFLVMLFSTLMSSAAMASSVLNLMVNESGMQRISYEELLQQGADLAGVKHRRLAITKNGNRVAVSSKGQNSTNKRARRYFGPGGFIEFYATVDASLYSDQTAYTLHVSRNLRRNIPRLSSPKFKRRAGVQSSYRASITIEDNAYYDFLSPSSTDPWHFGQQIGVGGQVGPETTFELENVAAGDVTLTAQIYGLVDIPQEGNDHHVAFFLNDQAAGDLQFNGNIAASLTQEQAGSVQNGQNKIRMDLIGIEGMPVDAVGLNKVVLNYPRLPIADENHLSGTLTVGQYDVSGFSSRSIRAYRLTPNGTVVRLRGVRRSRQAETDGSYHAKFVVADTANMMVVGENGYKQPSVALINDEQNIRQGDAQYLIIAHSSFMGAQLEAFSDMRSQQSQLSTKIVDVEQIYSQFGSHVPSAQAIKNYVAYAVANLGTRYLLLVGGDQYDYKHYQSNAVSHVPTLYASTLGGALQVQQNPVDSLYGDIDGDEVPDIPVGRFPVRTLTELGYIVEKITDYQARQAYAGLAVAVADVDDNGNSISFEEEANAVLGLMPTDWQNDTVLAFAQTDGAQVAKDKLFAAMDEGVGLATYFGHSAPRQWSKSSPLLMQTGDVPLLNNIDKPAVVTQWGCWNTYFVEPDSNSLSQAFLLGGYNGAATVLGASSLTSLSAERVMGKAIMPLMLAPGARLGDAVIAAKRVLFEQMPTANDVLLGWQILGDPALVINPE